MLRAPSAIDPADTRKIAYVRPVCPYRDLAHQLDLYRRYAKRVRLAGWCALCLRMYSNPLKLRVELSWSYWRWKRTFWLEMERREERCGKFSGNSSVSDP